MATGADVAAQVKRAFGDEAGVQITDSDILRWINHALQEINAKNKVLKTRSTSPLTKGTSTFSTDGLFIHQVQTLHLDGHPVGNRSFQEAEEYILKHDPTGQAQGRPQMWYSWGQEIYFWPSPHQDYVLSIYYIAVPQNLANMSDKIPFPDIYLNRVIEYVMAQAYELDEDNENSGFKLQQMEAGLDQQHGEDRAQNIHYGMITVLPEDGGYGW